MYIDIKHVVADRNGWKRFKCVQSAEIELRIPRRHSARAGPVTISMRRHRNNAVMTFAARVLLE